MKKRLFLNISNHPSDRWDDSQKEAVTGLFLGDLVGQTMTYQKVLPNGYPDHSGESSLEGVCKPCRLADIEFVDIQYPQISASASLADVERISHSTWWEIRNRVENKGYDEVVAMVQGEMTSLVYLVPALQALNIKVVAATTERVVVAEKDGVKTSVFKFVRFREYPKVILREDHAREMNKRFSESICDMIDLKNKLKEEKKKALCDLRDQIAERLQESFIYLEKQGKLKLDESDKKWIERKVVREDFPNPFDLY